MMQVKKVLALVILFFIAATSYAFDHVTLDVGYSENRLLIFDYFVAVSGENSFIHLFGIDPKAQYRISLESNNPQLVITECRSCYMPSVGFYAASPIQTDNVIKLSTLGQGGITEFKPEADCYFLKTNAEEKDQIWVTIKVTHPNCKEPYKTLTGTIKNGSLIDKQLKKKLGDDYFRDNMYPGSPLCTSDGKRIPDERKLYNPAFLYTEMTLKELFPNSWQF